ncbi:MAG: thioredoxin [Actinobacteria bacterium RBG_16_67_15]|nr:MAG: thioredoxin [Actinobacteria bacterium RBG_16_67_15]
MPHVKDVDQQQFAQEVLHRSEEVPVVVDFWAKWCGPCKVLGPSLERLAAHYGGAFELVKVDTDANQALAAQFGIQSIPTVFAFKGGKPVSQFVGALPEAAIRRWIDELLPTELDRMVERARDLAFADDEAGAEAVYREVLSRVSDHQDAATGLASLLIARGDTDEALIVLGKAPRTSEVEKLEAAARVTAAQGIDLSHLEARLAADPTDDRARLELGHALAAKGEWEAGLDHLLAVVRRGGELRDTARRAMVDVFGLLGADHPLTATYRRALANSLF